jgi:hypothetical protein
MIVAGSATQRRRAMASDLIDLMSSRTNLLWAALVSAGVSAGISFLFKLRETRYSAEVAYEYEQRKKLRELIGRYHGRLLNASVSMNHRFWNLYQNQGKGWLDANGDYLDRGAYYFRSSVYRFLNVFAVVRQLEAEAVLLDVRIAKKEDFVFLNYAAAFHWVMTDIALTEGLTYDSFDQTDHFFSDRFREYCDCCLSEGSFISLAAFAQLLEEGATKIEPVLHYFDGLNRKEGRLRWDRLVALHLLILSFINSFGYPRQYSSQKHFVDVAKQIENPKVLQNLVNWLPRHDLGSDLEAKRIAQAAKQVLRTFSASSPT